MPAEPGCECKNDLRVWDKLYSMYNSWSLGAMCTHIVLDLLLNRYSNHETRWKILFLVSARRGASCEWSSSANSITKEAML